MAEVIFDLETANGALATLKRVYEKREPMLQLPEELYYLKKIKKARKKIGEGLFDNIQNAQNQSFGIRNTGSGIDNEDLPDNAAPTFDPANWDMARSYLVLTLTGKAASRALTEAQEQSFLRNIAFLRADIENAYMKDCEFRLLNTPDQANGWTGLRGVLDNSAYVNGDTVTFTMDFTTNTTTRRYKLFQGLVENKILDVVSKTNANVVARIKIASIDVANGTFVGSLDADLAGTANEWYLFNQGDFSGGAGRDLNGLGGIIDDGTYTSTLGGVATSGQWQGIVLDNGGSLRDFAPAFMTEASLRTIKANGGKKTDSWMSFGMKQELIEYITRIINVQAQAGNRLPVKVNPQGDVEYWGPNAMINASAYMPAHEIFCTQPDGIIVEEQEALGPLVIGGDAKNPVFWQKLPRKDTWEATLVHELMQRTRRRNVHVKIGDLNQPTF